LLEASALSRSALILNKAAIASRASTCQQGQYLAEQWHWDLHPALGTICVLGLVGIGKGLQESSLLAVGVQSGLMLTLARVVVASRAGALLCSRVGECALALSATGLVGVCGLVNSRVAC